MQRRVVVVGMGMVNHFGDIETTWRNITGGKSGISAITLFDKVRFPCVDSHVAGEIKDWEKKLNILINEWDANSKNKELYKIINRYTNRSTQFALSAVIQSIANIKTVLLELTEEERQGAGVVVGTGASGHFNAESSTTNTPEIMKVYKKEREISDQLSAHQVPRDMINSASALTSILLKFHGPSSACSSACSSGNEAIIECCHRILLGEAEMMIAIGTDACVTPYVMEGFSQMKALSKKGVSCPFSLDRDGFVMAEGAGALVITSHDFAKKYGLSIFAEIVGYAESCDAYHIALPGKGQSICMNKALQKAEITHDKIDCINAHGTSTPEGDKNETAEIKKVFGDHAYKIPISSTKSMTGHGIGAAGTWESIFSILVIRDGIIPPTINLNCPDSQCDLDYVPNVARKKEVIYAMNNSFGFGGQNAVIIFKKFE